MKTYKLTKDYTVLHSGVVHEKGRLFVELDKNKVWLLATPIKKAKGSGFSHLLGELKRENYVEEVNLLNEKWVHPHINKEVKNEL